MPRFPFIPMTARARKDPLGHATLNQLDANVRALDSLALVEHNNTGVHNCFEVARTLGKFHWNGATYDTYLFNANYISHTNPAVGEIDITLKGSATFNFPGMVPLCNVATNDGKPYVAMPEIVSATSLKIRMQKLTSALGAGNAWAATNIDVDVAVHAPAKRGSSTVSSLAAVTPWQRRDFFHEAAGAGWCGLVENQGRVRKAALVEHDSSGNHNAVEIAREWISASQSGGVYTQQAGTSSSVTQVSTGVVEISTSFTYGNTLRMAGFATVQGATADELYIANVQANSTTKMRVYIYQFDFANKWWTAADADFTCFIYGS